MGKKKKSKKQEVNLGKLVKQIGYKSEGKLNKWLHQLFEDDQVMKLLKQGAKNHRKGLKELREYMNVIALYLNVPTKEDVANVAKISKQIEEKVDAIEERLMTGSTEVKRTKRVTKYEYKRELKKLLIQSIVDSSNLKEK